MIKRSIAIIGGGTSALFLGAFIDTNLFDVTIYERNKSLGRKFLVAGHGGFNLSHSEPMESFIKRYTPHEWLRPALLSFDNLQLRQWLDSIGIPTFIGSSKKIYPLKGIKPIEVLNTIINLLHHKGVQIQYEHSFTGWTTKDELLFSNNACIKADFTVFALGGGSWKVTGSDGRWPSLFNNRGIPTHPFVAANCAYAVKWPNSFVQLEEGAPLKNIRLRIGNNQQGGEVVITQLGIEGNAIYALSPYIQQELNQQGHATIYIDLKPMLSDKEVIGRLNTGHKSKTEALKKRIKLSRTAINLLKHQLNKTDFLNNETLAKAIKSLPLRIDAAGPLDKAISTTGGIALKAISSTYELQQMQRTYCIGEMLDWNAPTGGYLIQACASMGVYLAQHLNHCVTISKAE